MEPDLDGFREASVRLRAAMGTPTTFFTPTPTTWPEGTVLDPESSEPYDPTIAPLASGFASASAQALVVQSGATDAVAKAVETAIGSIEKGQAAVVVSAGDWEKLSLEDATLVRIYDDDWLIESARPDSVAGAAADRVIMRALQKGSGPPA